MSQPKKIQMAVSKKTLTGSKGISPSKQLGLP